MSLEKSALSIGEEASQLSAGVSKAERAADEIVEVSGSGRRVEDFMGAARERMMETRARYGFNEASDNVFGMAEKTEQSLARGVLKEGEEVVAELDYVHDLKGGKNLDFTELRDQVKGQVDAMNSIIEREGMTGLKQRILNYSEALEKEGRQYAKNLGSAGDEMAWLHEPDMRVGGAPNAITRAGSRRVNSILGGQANRLAGDILKMSNDVTRINPNIILRLPKLR